MENRKIRKKNPMAGKYSFIGKCRSEEEKEVGKVKGEGESILDYACRRWGGGFTSKRCGGIGPHADGEGSSPREGSVPHEGSEGSGPHGDNEGSDPHADGEGSGPHGVNKGSDPHESGIGGEREDLGYAGNGNRY